MVSAIAPKVEQAEMERTRRKPTESLTAYDYFLRGMARMSDGTRDTNIEALRNFERAIEIDPNFASAYGMCAYCYVWRKANAWLADKARAVAETEQLARTAARRVPTTRSRSPKRALRWPSWSAISTTALALIDRVLVLNPNLAAAWRFNGFVRVFLGQPDQAIEPLDRALRLGHRSILSSSSCKRVSRRRTSSPAATKRRSPGRRKRWRIRIILRQS